VSCPFGLFEGALLPESSNSKSLRMTFTSLNFVRSIGETMSPDSDVAAAKEVIRRNARVILRQAISRMRPSDISSTLSTHRRASGSCVAARHAAPSAVA
jgi:hypothetical protein